MLFSSWASWSFVAPPTHVGAWSMAVLLGQPFECTPCIEAILVEGTCTYTHRHTACLDMVVVAGPGEVGSC